MLEHATSAAECRMLVDMFLARSKLIGDVADMRTPPDPPLPRDSGANGLEKTIVEMLLGDGELDVQRNPSPSCCSVEPAESPLSAVDATFSV